VCTDYLLQVAVAWFSCDDNIVRYVLPVFVDDVMFLVMGRMARGVGCNDVGTVLE